MYRIEIKGLSEMQAAIEKMIREADAAGRAIVVESAAIVEARAKRNFEGSHRRGQPHVGGDKPNVVTGNLRRSITHDPPSRLGLASWATRVGPTAVYGRRVELGYVGTPGAGPGHQTTRPFPYFRPAVEQTRMQLLAVAARRWSAVL